MLAELLLPRNLTTPVIVPEKRCMSGKKDCWSRLTQILMRPFLSSDTFSVAEGDL